MWAWLKMIHKAGELSDMGSNHYHRPPPTSLGQEAPVIFPVHRLTCALKAHVFPTLLFVMSPIYHFAQPCLAIRSTLDCSLPIINSKGTHRREKLSLEKKKILLGKNIVEFKMIGFLVWQN